MDLKYKGISREKINEIQKVNMPKFSIPSMKDVDWNQVEISPIQTAIDEMAKKESRNYDIYIICEMAKKFLDIVSTDQDYYKLKYLEENKMRKEDMKDWTRERLEKKL